MCGFSWYSPGYQERIFCAATDPDHEIHRGQHSDNRYYNRDAAFVRRGYEHRMQWPMWEPTD